MLKKLFHFLLVLFGCLHMVGGPYAAFQAYAWTTMLVDYSREDGFFQATRDTFSGEKPCALCKKIRTAEQSDTQEKAPLSPISTKMGKLFQEMVPCSVASLEKPACLLMPDVPMVPFHASAVGISECPPTPPPRILC